MIVLIYKKNKKPLNNFMNLMMTIMMLKFSKVNKVRAFKN